MLPSLTPWQHQHQYRQYQLQRHRHVRGVLQLPHKRSSASEEGRKRPVRKVAGLYHHALTVPLQASSSGTSSLGGQGSSRSGGSFEAIPLPPPSTSIGGNIIQLQTTPMALLHLSAWAQLGA